MKLNNTTIALSFLALALGACATGEKLSTQSLAFHSVPAGKARIAIYRTKVIGAAVQPSVVVADQETGVCKPKGVFFVDVAPGKHVISATTEATDYVAVNARAGQISYVECSIDSGIVIGRPDLEIVDKIIAEQVIGELALTGKYNVE